MKTQSFSKINCILYFYDLTFVTDFCKTARGKGIRVIMVCVSLKHIHVFGRASNPVPWGCIASANTDRHFLENTI